MKTATAASTSADGYASNSPATEDQALIARDDAGAVLGELISALPLSPCHFNLFGAVALVWVSEGTLEAMWPWLLADAKDLYQLDPFGEGALVGCLTVGRLLCLLCVAPLADAFGRWPVVFWGLTATLGFCFALNAGSGLGIATVGVCFLLGGFLFDLPRPVAKMLLSEVLPAARRGLLLNLCHAFWQVGAMLLVGATLTSTSTAYLALIALGPVTAALVGFAAIGVAESPLFGVRESPLWLLRARGVLAADAALSRLAARCGAPRPPGVVLPPLPPPPPRCRDWWRPYAALFSRPLWRLSVVATICRACLMLGMAWELELAETAPWPFLGHPMSLPRGSGGSGCSYGPRSAPSSAWELAVASGARLGPPQKSRMCHLRPPGALHGRDAHRQRQRHRLRLDGARRPAPLPSPPLPRRIRHRAPFAAPPSPRRRRSRCP